jgi:hypothetical protein
LDKATPLHEYYKKRLTQHITNTILPALRDKVDENLLKVYIKEWKDYTLLTHFMRKMFSYLVSVLPCGKNSSVSLFLLLHILIKDEKMRPPPRYDINLLNRTGIC